MQTAEEAQPEVGASTAGARADRDRKGPAQRTGVLSMLPASPAHREASLVGRRALLPPGARPARGEHQGREMGYSFAQFASAVFVVREGMWVCRVCASQAKGRACLLGSPCRGFGARAHVRRIDKLISKELADFTACSSRSSIDQATARTSSASWRKLVDRVRSRGSQ